MTKKEKRKETIFCIAVAILVTVLYTIDLPGSAVLLVLIAPLTLFWIKHRTR